MYMENDIQYTLGLLFVFYLSGVQVKQTSLSGYFNPRFNRGFPHHLYHKDKKIKKKVTRRCII